MPDHVSRPETLGLSPGSGFISVSSAAELQSHMYVALDQRYVTRDIFDLIYQQADKTAKMISGLITYLRANENRFQQKKREKPKKQ